MTICKSAVILKTEKGAAGRRLAPHSVTEVTACLEAGRLLLVFCLKKQAYDTDDHKTELEQLRVCKHKHHPLSLEGARSPLRDGRGNRLPFYWQRLRLSYQGLVEKARHKNPPPAGGFFTSDISNKCFIMGV